jgi:hypothetical protein
MVLPNFHTASWLISDRELTINKIKSPKAFFLFIVVYFKLPYFGRKELLV